MINVKTKRESWTRHEQNANGLTLCHLNTLYFAKLKILHNGSIFGTRTIFMYQFKVNGYISVNGNISPSKHDINNRKTPPWS